MLRVPKSLKPCADDPNKRRVSEIGINRHAAFLQCSGSQTYAKKARANRERIARERHEPTILHKFDFIRI